MKIEHLEVYGLRAAIRGMRNPMNSWAKSDSKIRCNKAYGETDYNVEDFRVGQAD